MPLICQKAQNTTVNTRDKYMCLNKGVYILRMYNYFYIRFINISYHCCRRIIIYESLYVKNRLRLYIYIYNVIFKLNYIESHYLWVPMCYMYALYLQALYMIIKYFFFILFYFVILCIGKLANAWGLGGLLRHHSKLKKALFSKSCK